MNAAINYPVRRFKSLKAALKELEPFIRDGQHLETGKPFRNIGGLRSREILANWLLCVAINSVTQPDRLTPDSDPVGGDGVISDTLTGETWQMEHVLVPRAFGGRDDTGALILKQIRLKWEKGGAAYATGKTLVVFLNAPDSVWIPNKVAQQLPQPLHFEAVWVVGLQGVENGEYVYTATRLDLRHGNAPTWRVRIANDFESWEVEAVQ
jgi:hypothetical protein